ncbi:hypothetical protein AAEX28_13060 [Lentisphaerota bacterium WC36G]|nr:hypothetical protein LJT99_15885 [Lentisphaerae bacterium WC36]
MEIKRAELSSSTYRSPAQKIQEWLTDNSARLVICVICVFLFLALLYMLCGISNFLMENVGKQDTPGTLGLFQSPLTSLIKLIGSGVVVWYVLKNKSGMK